MKLLLKLVLLIAAFQLFPIYAYAQQSEDVVYLKNGSIIHGTITDSVQGVSIKIQTKDNNIFVFKTDEILKMTKEEVTLKKDEIKKDVKDSTKNKVETEIIKKDTLKNKDVKVTQNKEKELLASNSFTIQPFGLFTLLSNIEYDRAITRVLSMGVKINLVTFLARYAVTFTGKQKDVDNAESIKKTLSGIGIGTHIRFYPGVRAVEGFFLGGALDWNSLKYDEIKTGTSYNQSTMTNEITKTKIPHNASLTRLEFEIGSRSKLSSKQDGFAIQWSLGAGAGFWNDGVKKKGVIPVLSFGFGIGYAF